MGIEVPLTTMVRWEHSHPSSGNFCKIELRHFFSIFKLNVNAVGNETKNSKNGLCDKSHENGLKMKDIQDIGFFP